MSDLSKIQDLFYFKYGMRDMPQAILEEQIRQQSAAYYNDEPLVSDEEFDLHKDLLRALYPDSKVLSEVGAPSTSDFPKVSHGVPMGSQHKVTSPEAVLEWIQKRSRKGIVETFLLSEKLDGASIHLKYVGGNLKQALTRGDGLIGEDITANVKRMQGVPLKLSSSFSGSIRGEIIVTKSDFSKYFPDKKSTRNTASGVSRRLDGEGCEFLSVFCYQVVDGKDFASDDLMFDQLKTWGFIVPNYYVCAMTLASEVPTPVDVLMRYEEGKRASLNYDIDGLVMTLNDRAYQLSLGESSNCPEGAVAIKFQSPSRETTIQEIVSDVGGSGQITPVAIFDPVHLLGAVVTKASLYNWPYIHKIRAKVGSRVLVSRANDVIPRVCEVIQNPATTDYAMPNECPRCGAPVRVDNVHIYCTNVSGCPAQVVGRLKAWISEQGILEWGDALLTQVVENLGVKDVVHLYNLTQKDLLSLDRMGAKSAENVFQSLHTKKTFPLPQYLGGLSIPGIGASTIQLLIDAGYRDLSAIEAMTQAQLVKVSGIGEGRAKSIRGWFQNGGLDLLKRLQQVGVTPVAQVVGTLTGKSFCFTGSMKHKRDDLANMVTSRGGTVKASVGKNLTYLVIADPNSGSSKAVAAAKNGTKCISEEEFLSLCL